MPNFNKLLKKGRDMMDFGNIRYAGDASKFVEAKDDPNEWIFLNQNAHLTPYLLFYKYLFFYFY